MYTNQTAHFHLPQYTKDDIHNELTDDNEAYRIIDNALYQQGLSIASNDEQINSLNSELNDESTGVKADISVIKQTDERQDTDITSIRTSLINQDVQIQSMENNINGVSSRVNNLNTNVDNIDARVTELEHAPALIIDTAMSDLSDHAVENRVIKAYVDSKEHSASYNSEEEMIIL